MMNMTYEHWLIFGGVCIATWFVFIYFWPRFLLLVFKQAILTRGFGEGPIPVNTLYTQPEAFFADPLHGPASASRLGTTGVNRDTLMTVGWLDLSKGPVVLHVPDMNDRYYSVQFTDPTKNINFAYVGKRTTGTRAGVFLITGRKWKGQVPVGMTQISSPTNGVLVFGRVLVLDISDLPTAYALSKQLELTPLNH